MDKYRVAEAAHARALFGDGLDEGWAAQRLRSLDDDPVSGREQV